MAKTRKIIGLYPYIKDNNVTAYEAARAIQDGDQTHFYDSQIIPEGEITPWLKSHKRSTIAVGLMPSGRAFHSTIRLPPIEPKRIPQIMNFEAVQTLPFDLEETFWNYQLIENKDDPNIDARLSAVQKKWVEQVFPYKRVSKINTSANALPSLYQNKDDDKLEAILAVGPDSSEIVISKNGINRWSRTYMVGQKDAQKDLISEFKRTFEFIKSKVKGEISCILSPNAKPYTMKGISKETGIPIEERPVYSRFSEDSAQMSEEHFYAAAAVLAVDNPINSRPERGLGLSA